ncbi:hypothetical protein [Mariniphaga sp.]|uniref:hypothetical protein n=1 Tax=Mariniphaga sp. TaxID=1954475 RepID=UPI0035638087
MPEINKHITLPKNVATGDDLDYAFLRKKGLEYIEQLASDLWTDYNSHDPGITILEMLAYALTDLGARLEMPLENILAPEDENAPAIGDQFFKALQILPSQPVTEADYRKLFIDIEGVKNCWLKKYKKTVFVDCKNNKLSYNSDDFKDTDAAFKTDFQLQGLYSVIVDFDDFDPDEFPDEDAINDEKDRIYEEIKTRYHANRNLCEDLVDISEVLTHPIAVCASIELNPEADEELVHAKVLRTIDNYFSPSLKFYSLKQMVEKGYTSDQIFDGPVLESGFIDPVELKNAQLRTEVRLSDIMNLIMNIDGVKVIKDITINDCHNPDDDSDEWIICVEDGKKPVRCSDSAYSYYKSVLPVNVNHNKVDLYLDEMEKAAKAEQEQARFNMEPEIPAGEFLNTGEATTIQNDFPDTYGIGPNGLPSRVETKRKAQAKQLKGYLLFFDQMLATYFAHLGKVKDMLSVDNELKKTYFTQAVKDIKGFSDLVSGYPENDDEALTELLFSGLDNRVERKNKILDHLISRFAEKFSDYTFLMKQLYGVHAEKVILQTKESFLKDYDQTSMKRGSAFNYFRQPNENLWNTKNVSGVQKRISRLVGIKNYNRTNLSESFVEIYDFLDADGKKVYRWRIRNEADEIILTATENYPNTRLAEKELHQSVEKIIETTEEIIEKVFAEEEIVDETIFGNLQVQLSETGKFSFNVINREADPNSAQWVIARQYLYYDSPEELKNAMLDFLLFMIYVFSEEGIFLVEHILLRPDVTEDSVPFAQFMPICDDDCEGCNPVDPYSFRVTVVLPGWAYRFADSDFRNYLENLIRKELPAHVLARICWVGHRKNQVPDEENDMLQFENTYREFLISKTNLEQEQNEEKLTQLIDKMNKLNSIYPSGRLIDCDDEDEKLEGRIILGRTNIGNL